MPIKLNKRENYIRDVPNNIMSQDTTDIKESTELGESLKELNDDSISPNTRMSGIDLRSVLHPLELSGILAIDTLVQFRFLPVSSLSFTRQKKRLSVSQNGKGRDDIVKIVSGKRDGDQQGKGMTFIERVTGQNKNNGV
jgi:hypothetical protein